jgi:hypothetical protein
VPSAVRAARFAESSAWKNGPSAHDPVSSRFQSPGDSPMLAQRIAPMKATCRRV